ncbi:hypothetical protein D3C73_1327920 [compost metagenome]
MNSGYRVPAIRQSLFKHSGALLRYSLPTRTFDQTGEFHARGPMLTEDYRVQLLDHYDASSEALRFRNMLLDITHIRIEVLCRNAAGDPQGINSSAKRHPLQLPNEHSPYSLPMITGVHKYGIYRVRFKTGCSDYMILVNCNQHFTVLGQSADVLRCE